MRLNGYRDVSAGHAREDVMRNPARWTASAAVGGAPMRLLAKPNVLTRLQTREPRAVHRPAGSFRDVVPGDRSAGGKPAGRIGAATHLRGATSGAELDGPRPRDSRRVGVQPQEARRDGVSALVVAEAASVELRSVGVHGRRFSLAIVSL